VATRPLMIAMNGVTGRMGLNQHLRRSILAIRDEGGVVCADGTRVVPEPILVGRDEGKLCGIAKEHGLGQYTTDLPAALREAEVYFDAQVTSARSAAVRAAIAAGLHVYAEKPLTESVEDALELAGLARAAGVRTGVVRDKLFLPGLRKLRRLVDGGFFGRVLSVRGEFGYWVFEGDWQAPQRPSWNYRAEDGGGIALDMLCHWHYVLSEIFGPVRSIQCVTATHIPERVDERGEPYQATADDAVYATMELAGDVVAQINSSWATRVDRDELVEFHVDGTEGSAVAGLHRCRVQHRAMTPRAVWNPDLPTTEDYRARWSEVPDNEVFGNGFKAQWELFLRHVVDGTPFLHDFAAAARDVQLARLGLRSAREGRRLAVPELDVAVPEPGLPGPPEQAGSGPVR
jgi:predicted dehydrogenase